MKKAYCSSFKCYSGIGSKGTHKPNAIDGKLNCPDCGYALLWTKKASYKTRKDNSRLNYSEVKTLRDSGMKMKEIAKELACAESTVSRLLSGN